MKQKKLNKQKIKINKINIICIILVLFFIFFGLSCFSVTKLSKNNTAGSFLAKEEKTHITNDSQINGTGTQSDPWDISGVLNDSVYAYLDDTGLLTIYGTGMMTDFSEGRPAPWYNQKEDITKVVINNGVTKIGKRAFYECSSLTTIEIPSGITTIDREVFWGCSSLTDINLPEGITSIGYSAFYNCSNLTSIDLPETLTNIVSHAFYGCSNLTSIEIPEGVTKIEIYTFYHCSSLERVGLPDGLTDIGFRAFEGCVKLSNIEFPDSLTYLGGSVFYDCRSLTSLSLPDGLTTMRNQVFANCSSLTSIDLPDGLTTMENQAFSDCSNLTSIELPDSMTYIGESVFYNCSSLTSIEIPEGVTILKQGVFHNCTSLTNVNLPAGITSMGNSAFNNCASLTNIDLPAGLTSMDNFVFYKCNNLTSIKLPEGLETIGNSVFCDCSSLVSAEINSSLISIGDYTFEGCSNLTSIELPNSLTTMGMSTFSGCRSLASAKLSSQLTSIGSGTFYNCSSLTNIDIPSGVTEMGTSVFSGCSSLVNVKLPEGLESIEASTFRQCTSLKVIELPEGITSIGRFAFYVCSNLESINIPAGVTNIDDNAFGACFKLVNLELPLGITNIGKEGLFTLGDNKIKYQIYNNDGTVTATATTIRNANSNIGKRYLEPIAPTLSISNINNTVYVGDSLELSNVTVREYYENSDYTRDCDIEKVTMPSSVTFNSTLDNSVEVKYTYWNDGYQDFTVTNDIEITVNPYTINYNLNGGKLLKEEGLTQEITSITDTLYNQDDIIKEGYTFVGWKKSGTEILINSFDDIKTYSENGKLNLKAAWKVFYVITYDLNGGIPGDDYTANESVEAGSIIRIENDQSTFVTPKKYRKLDGYEINGVRYEIGDTYTVNSDTTIKFLWVLTFADIPKGSWYYEPVEYVADLGYITGYNEETFGPFDNLKREQLVNILWRIEGNPDASELDNNFSDVPDDTWYTEAIKWANANDIVKGYGGTTLFGVGDNIIRQDLAIMLTNYAKYKGLYSEPTASLDNFLDKYSVSSYAIDAVRWATENSIISGNSNEDGTKTIAPLANARRCETAVMLMRFCENIL